MSLKQALKRDNYTINFIYVLRSLNKYFLLVDRAVLDLSKPLGKSSRAFKIPLYLYSIYPHSATYAHIRGTLKIRFATVNINLKYYLDQGIIKTTTRTVAAGPIYKAKRAKSYMLTIEGRKYIENFYTEILNQLPEKHRNAILEDPNFNDF